jgi:hypothetical protein
MLFWESNVLIFISLVTSPPLYRTTDIFVKRVCVLIVTTIHRGLKTTAMPLATRLFFDCFTDLGCDAMIRVLFVVYAGQLCYYNDTIYLAERVAEGSWVTDLITGGQWRFPRYACKTHIAYTA